MAAVPTPEFAPSTNTVSPGLMLQRPTSMCHAVTNTSGMLASSSNEYLEVCGTGNTFARGTAISSQLPPSFAYPKTENCGQKFCFPAMHFSQTLQKFMGAS